jgi:hypothetical protein
MNRTSSNDLEEAMRDESATGRSIDRFTLPWDLSEWAAKPELLAWLDEGIGALDWDNPELLAILKANPAYPPRFWLTLLSYAYAQGIFESEEVVALYFKESPLRIRFPGQTTSAAALAKFRRENRGLLKWCLLELFKRVLREKFELGDALLPAGLRRYLMDAATVRLDVARDIDRAASGAL